jgi:hypothetical protein
LGANSFNPQFAADPVSAYRSTKAEDGGRLRAALLASVALAALGAPRAAAACSGANQTISGPSTPGPIFGTGGNVTVDSGGGVAGRPTGVYARNCGIGTLSNRGAIGGVDRTFGSTKAGGVAVRAASGRTIDLMSNAKGASITGGSAGSSDVAAGGAAVSNAGTITSLRNSGKITGGSGGFSSAALVAGAGGVGVSNAGTITTLTNRGAINGGSGGFAAAGVLNTGKIATLTNGGTINGGGGSVLGGAGVSNLLGTITTLTNRRAT